MNAIKNLGIFLIYAALMIVSIFGIPVFIAHLLFLFMGAGKRIETSSTKLLNGLMEGETLIQSAAEVRINALFTRRALIAITSSRVIYVERPILGGFKMIDIQWKDLLDAELSENTIPALSGSRLSFAHATDKRDFFIDVPSRVDTEIYRVAQRQEQAWEEKNRIRLMEEVRAASGGAYISASAGAPTNGSNGSAIMDEISRAKEMLDQGVISDAEFDELKSKILSQNPAS